MIRLSTLLLAPPVGERLRARYDDYRQHGASWLSASLGCRRRLAVCGRRWSGR